MKMPKRFSLTFLMSAVTMFAIAGRIITERGRNQRRAVSEIVAAGGQVYSHEFPKRKRYSHPRNALIYFFGFDNLCSVVAVILVPTQDSPGDEQLDLLSRLPYLRHVAIGPRGSFEGPFPRDVPGGLTDHGARRLLEELRTLNGISLTSACLTNSIAGEIISDPRFKTVGIIRHPDYGGDAPAFTVSSNGKRGIQTSTVWPNTIALQNSSSRTRSETTNQDHAPVIWAT